MAVPILATPVGNWKRFLVQLAEDVGLGLFTYLVSQLEQGAALDEAELAWMRLHCVITRSTPTGTSEDKAVCTFDLVNITGGAVDTTWTSGDFTACETLLDTFWTTVMGQSTANHTLDEYRWYLRRFNPLTTTKPYQDSGPPVRITDKNIVGSSTSYTPYQVAMSVTEKTAWPHHWGRVYLPGVASNNVLTNGRFGSTPITTFANAFQTLYAGLQTAEFFPVVPVTQVNKQPVRGLLGVSSIQIDDIPDVVRSRRPKQPAIRTVRP